MDLKTKGRLLKAFADFVRIVFAIAGEDGIRFIEEAFAKWRLSKTSKPKTTKKRAKRKKS